MLNYGFYNMNCMDGMREFPDKFFDIAVVDPPYFAGPNKRRYYGRSESTTLIKRREYDIIDTWDVPGMEYFDELIRVSRHQIVWGCNYFDYHFGSGRIVWDKCRSNMTFSDAEIAGVKAYGLKGMRKRGRPKKENSDECTREDSGRD